MDYSVTESIEIARYEAIEAGANPRECAVLVTEAQWDAIQSELEGARSYPNETPLPQDGRVAEILGMPVYVVDLALERPMIAAGATVVSGQQATRYRVTVPIIAPRVRKLVE